MNNQIARRKLVHYNFFFTSLIPPFFNNKTTTVRFSKNLDKKIMIKQSYMLLVWFYYISYLKRNNKDDYKIKITTLPFKQRKFTLTKAPIAHKTRSKEQYTYGYYSFKVSFTSIIKENVFYELNINSALFFIFLNRKYLPYFETNMLFLKYARLRFCLADPLFFNYYNFCNFTTS